MAGFSYQIIKSVLWGIRYVGRLGLFAIAITLIFSVEIHAQISPGDLHRTHAFLEGVENCSNCHSPEGDQLAEKCLACHSVIADQHQKNEGLHARTDYAECVLCHVEHQGRDFELIYFKGGINAFNHDITGYTLDGSHTSLECRKCHNSGNIVNPEISNAKNLNLEKTFLGLESGCASCHFDQHRGQLGDQCQKCHTQSKWKPTSGFSHDSTSYPLTGLHKKAICAKCHIPLIDSSNEDNRKYANYKPVEHNNCNACHTDIHKGQLGNDCRSCHITNGWKNIRTASFDHNQTKYPLKGMHAEVQCGKCHTDRAKTGELKFNKCRDCHQDYHDNVFAKRDSGGDCEECHTVAGFRPALYTVDKHSAGAFPLKGAHLAVPCGQCHISKIANESDMWRFAFSSKRCRDCHNDPHKGRVDKLVKSDGCLACHTENDWKEVLFDHSATDFKLQGKHKKIACVECHNGLSENNLREVDFREIADDCKSCHADKHRGQFANTDGKKECSACHTYESWKIDSFDHSNGVRFVLDGAHINVACAKCHISEFEQDESFIRYRPLDMRCVACHSESPG